VCVCVCVGASSQGKRVPAVFTVMSNEMCNEMWMWTFNS
jgi:hypothetical protein